MPIAEGTRSAEQPGGSPASPEKPLNAGAILLALAMAAIGFMSTAAVVHAGIRDPLHLHADLRSEKLVMLDQWSGKYFSAAFGSSHMHDGFNPAAFDAAMAGTSGGSRSVNLAIEGGAQSEQFVMAHEFLQHLRPPAAVGAPSEPCTVILELSAGANLLSTFLIHPRSIDIYDWQTTHLISHFVSPKFSPSQRFGRTGFAAMALGMHYANVGMLSNLIFSPPLNEEMVADQTKDDRRGLDVLTTPPVNLARIERLRATAPARPEVTEGILTPGNSELIEKLARESPVHNVSFVYVVMPYAGDLEARKEYPDHVTVSGPTGPMLVPIINLSRPDLYAELYKPQWWFDEEHLNGEGSAVLSRILADELKKWYAVHGGPPPCG